MRILRNNKRGLIRNEKGQMVIESVLLLTVLIGSIIFATNKLRENNFIGKLVSGPWVKLAGMIECGVWDEASKACQLHPNQVQRNVSHKPN